ncbi:hypothetical protein GCM10027082_36330 [Comamonas humi]
MLPDIETATEAVLAPDGLFKMKSTFIPRHSMKILTLSAVLVSAVLLSACDKGQAPAPKAPAPDAAPGAMTPTPPPPATGATGSEPSKP